MSGSYEAEARRRERSGEKQGEGDARSPSRREGESAAMLCVRCLFCTTSLARRGGFGVRCGRDPVSPNPTKRTEVLVCLLSTVQRYPTLFRKVRDCCCHTLRSLGASCGRPDASVGPVERATSGAATARDRRRAASCLLTSTVVLEKLRRPALVQLPSGVRLEERRRRLPVPLDDDRPTRRRIQPLHAPLLPPDVRDASEPLDERPARPTTDDGRPSAHLSRQTLERICTRTSCLLTRRR